MKKVTLLFLGCLSFASAATGTFGSYAEVFTTTGTVHVAQSYGGSNPAFDGANFGSYTLAQTLGISNASLVTFKSGGGDVTGAEIQYRVYQIGSTAPAFQIAALNFGSNAISTDLGGNTFSGAGDQEWRGLSGGTINLLDGITSTGNYNVEIFYRASTSEGDRFSNNGADNFIATFDVSAIPEPTTAFLSMFGLLALVRRRR